MFITLACCLLRMGNKNSRRNLSPEQIQERDRLIDLGLSLKEISEISGVSYQAISIYIMFSGKSKKWKYKRDNIKKREIEIKEEIRNEELKRVKCLEEITAQIFSHMKYQAEIEGWPSIKAVEYSATRKRKLPYKFEDLITVFKRYKKAAGSDTRLSYRELCEGTKISEMILSHILKNVNLKPFYEEFSNVRRLTESDKETLQKILNLGFPVPDIGYFLGVLPSTISQFYKRRNIKIYRTETRIRPKGTSEVLTYRLASQFYEAMDIGFDTQEIMELYDRDIGVIELAKEKRSEIEPKIINLLRVMYNSEINKPYLEN